MTTVSIWTGASGQNQTRDVILIGGFLYAGFNLSPGIVIKIDPASMTTSDVWQVTSPTQPMWGLREDGNYFYAGQSSSPARVYQFSIVPPASGLKASGSIPHRLVAAGLI
jgi:hypothetical protein